MSMNEKLPLPKMYGTKENGICEIIEKINMFLIYLEVVPFFSE